MIEEELPRLLPLIGEIIQNLTGDHQNNFYEGQYTEISASVVIVLYFNNLCMYIP